MGVKKPRRIMIRVTEEMEKTVAALAEINHRSVQDQYRFLVEWALDQRLGEGRKETMRLPRQPMSANVSYRQEKSA